MGNHGPLGSTQVRHMETLAFSTGKRIPLSGHEPMSRTTLHGWPAVLLGGPFLGFGLFFFFIGMGWLDHPKSSIHAPLWVVASVGGIFAGLGEWLVVHGLMSKRRMWNMKQGQQHMPDRPWMWDFPWQAQGISDDIDKKSLQSLVALIVFAIFLAPFNWIAFFAEQGDVFWKGVVGVLDVVVFFGVGWYCLKQWGQYWTFGNSYARFQTFPFYLGTRMDLILEPLPPDITQLQLDLRYIEEVYERRGSGRNRKTVVVCYQLYKDSKTVRGEYINATGELSVSWNLPDEPTFTSTPSERPAKFWELEIRGERLGLDYRTHFLLPVYARLL